jgi:tRNA(adenine34) deaminase
MTTATADEYWMREALAQARFAQEAGEVPVGAVLVRNGVCVGSGWNRPIGTSDPTAHAEVVTLRNAGIRLGNYRMPGTVLYVTLEPCVMCAGALVHARVSRVVFGAADPKGGAAGSVFNLLPSDARFNHRVEVTGGVMAEKSAELLRTFFRAKR